MSEYNLMWIQLKFGTISVLKCLLTGYWWSSYQISLTFSEILVALRATALQLKITHAKRQNTNKLRKHLHQFDKTCAAFRKRADHNTTHLKKVMQRPQRNTLDKSNAGRPQHNGSVSRGHLQVMHMSGHACCWCRFWVTPLLWFSFHQWFWKMR